jgi:hypothetical protein
MKRIVVKLSGMPSGLPARPATTRWLSATSCEYPAAAQASSRDGETGTVIALDSSYTGAMQAHHQGHLRR